MKNILETKNLTKNFGGVRALDNLSFSLPKGQITGLVGPNGSGKTTLINVLSGILAHDGGEILFLNSERKKIVPWENKVYSITRTFQQIRLFDQMSVLDNILIILTERSPLYSIFEKHSEYHLQQASEILKKVGLYEKRLYDAAELSYGQRKLLDLFRHFVWCW